MKTNTSSQTLSDCHKKDQDSHGYVKDNQTDGPVDGETQKRSWSGVVKNGSKQETSVQLEKLHKYCQIKYEVVAKAEKNIKVRKARGRAFKKEALDEQPSVSGKTDSKEVIHQSSSSESETSVFETKTTSAEPRDFDSVEKKWCKTDEHHMTSVPELNESIQNIKTVIKATFAENKIADQMSDLDLRPQSGYMTVTKPKSKQAPVSVVLGSDEDCTLLCMPCDREGIAAPAFGYCSNCCEHLCQTCFNHHKKATPSRHHVLLDKGAMPRVQQHPTSTTLLDKADEFITYCVRHKEKPLEYLCTKHKQLACSVCVVLDHRNCDHIGYIPELAVSCINSKEYQDTTERMDTVIKLSKDIRKNTTEMVKLSNDSLNGALPHIKQFRQKINKRVDELENEIRCRSEKLREDNEKKFRRIEVTCDYIERSVIGISSKVKQLNASYQADKLFTALLISDYILQDHEANISKLQIHKDIHEYKFVPYSKFLELLDDAISVGSMSEDVKSSAIERVIHD